MIKSIVKSVRSGTVTNRLISADNELFNSWVSLAKDALGVDDKTVAAILKAAE